MKTNLPATETPDWLARDMVSLANVKYYHSVLEPSAGKGNLVIALKRVINTNNQHLLAIELNKDNCFELEKIGVSILHRDFLQVKALKGMYHRVVMNPPLNAIDHLKHADFCMAPGGRLVALVHTSVAESFISSSGGYKYDLPENTFIHPINQDPLPCSILIWDKGT